MLCISAIYPSMPIIIFTLFLSTYWVGLALMHTNHIFLSHDFLPKQNSGIQFQINKNPYKRKPRGEPIVNNKLYSGYVIDYR